MQKHGWGGNHLSYLTSFADHTNAGVFSSVSTPSLDAAFIGGIGEAAINI